MPNAVVVLSVLVAAIALAFIVWRARRPGGAPRDLSDLHADELGLESKVLSPGHGPIPNQGDRVVVHYVGWLENGQRFDSSRARNRPFEFWLGRGEVIKGWDAIVSRMQVGEKRLVRIPPELAYGDRRVGTIPPGSPLLFEIELLSIVDLRA
ncbi:FKBP-type peptidyl-prolyl cis-trans isomerase [bacterium]|nr:FKBP-type peptidyl-prolyl cis-trans isomerase [bacterium]